MPGLATVVSRIRTDLDRGTDFDSRIKEALENAIKFYRAKRFGWNEARIGFATADEYRSLSVDVVKIDTLTVDRTSTRFPLIPKPNDWIIERKVDPNFTSEPVYYAMAGRQLRFYPAPDQTYSFEATALLDLREISVSASDSASNAWLNEGEELIRMRAMAEVLEVYIDGPEALVKADRCRIREREAYQQLRSEANLLAASGRMQPWI